MLPLNFLDLSLSSNDTGAEQFKDSCTAKIADSVFPPAYLQIILDTIILLEALKLSHLSFTRVSISLGWISGTSYSLIL